MQMTVELGPFPTLPERQLRTVLTWQAKAMLAGVVFYGL
jgi:hypothetical protein